MFRIICIILFLFGIPVLSQDRPRITLQTISQLSARQPFTNEVVEVLGYASLGDWGSPKLFRWDSTSTLATNTIIVKARPAVGRYIHEWDGDVRAFGAIPFQSRHSAVPWGYKTTNSPIGTNDFSLFIRTTLPTSYVQPHGLFELGPVPSTNQSTSPELLSSIGLRASPDVWGVVFRGTNGSSAAGSTVDEGSVLESSPSALSAYAGQTVNIVITRSYTNAVIYFNGTNVSSLFTLSNPLGWSKSLALGQSILVQSGFNGNVWYWPKPVTRFALWNSALSAGQAADPEGTASKVIDFTPDVTTEPADLTDRLNAASDYVQSIGGGRLYMPTGVYRVDGNVRIGKQAHWQGDGSSPYPSTFRQGFRSSATTIVPWFGAANKVFVGDQSQSGEMCLTPRTIGILNGITSSRWLRSKISDLTINGDLSYSSEGVVLDRVAAVAIHNVGFRGLQNHEIRAFGANSIQIFGCEGGTLGRGLDIRGCADVTILGCFFDGPRGPVLRFVANLSRVADSVFEFALNPRSSTPALESPTAVNTATDTFAVTNSYGHKFHTGQAIRFDAGSGTLPTNLTATTDYYVYVTGDNTFKVSTTYGDEVSLVGAMYGNSFVDVGDAGSGIWYVGSGPAVGMSVTGDHNSFSGNQSQQNYEGALRVEGGNGHNAFTANHFIMNGLGNTDTNIAAVVVTGSPYNRFVNNSVDDRDLSGFSQKAFVLDSDSDYNTFIGNSWNVDTPYTFGDPAKQLVIDSKQSVYQWNGSYGNLYIPAAAGFTEWTPQVWANAVPVQFDYTSGRLLLWDGDSWMHAVTAPYGSNTYWSANSGTLSAVNNGSPLPFLAFSGTYPGNSVYVQVNDASGANDASIVGLYRNYGTNSSSYGSLPAYTKYAELQMGGWKGSTSADAAVGSRITAWSDAIDWSSTNRGSQVNVDLVPNGSTTVTTAITFQAPLTPSTNDTMLLLSYWNGASWVASSKRVSFGTNDSAGAGFKVLKVAN